MKAPRILMVHRDIGLYGCDRSFAAAVKALRERYPQASIDVVLPAPGPLLELVEPHASHCLFEARGILHEAEFKRHPWRSLRALWQSWRLYRRLVGRYDICYVNTLACVAAIAALRETRGGYVHVREISSRTMASAFARLLHYARVTPIYNSYATAFAFGLPGRIIHNGVEPMAVAPNPGPAGRPRRIAILGRISPRKGQRFVLAALARFGRALPIELRIVGDMPRGCKSLLAEAASACVQRIEIQGFAERLDPHFEWADFMLVPSILPEPSGRVAIESFSAGRPVIASDAGGLQEIVTDGENGFLYEPGEPEALVRALERALALTPEQYRSMADAARQTYLQRFTMRRHLDALANAVAWPPMSAMAIDAGQAPQEQRP